MNYSEFIDSLASVNPPDVSLPLKSLWYDAKGDWEKAHHLISDIENLENNRIHAYLHRKEGDIWNADYWYSRSGEKRKDIPLEEEWKTLVIRFLQD
jgi:hypothetical protein